jgi:hypothetical protein
MHDHSDTLSHDAAIQNAQWQHQFTVQQAQTLQQSQVAPQEPLNSGDGILSVLAVILALLRG